MVTDKAIEELLRWAQAATQGDAETAKNSLAQFYHLGASLLASKEFQAAWRAKRFEPLGPTQLDDACKVLATIAEVEAMQVMTYGKAPGLADAWRNRV